mmetsp:Transcript_5893/g.9737  ORF Transcript_5893/g.9737 Transcript_5893/m.9737 type:complete len:245 (-) Transcript_5893:1765-2499(-)
MDTACSCCFCFSDFDNAFNTASASNESASWLSMSYACSRSACSCSCSCCKSPSSSFVCGLLLWLVVELTFPFFGAAPLRLCMCLAFSLAANASWLLYDAPMLSAGVISIPIDCRRSISRFFFRSRSRFIFICANCWISTTFFLRSASASASSFSFWAARAFLVASRRCTAARLRFSASSDRYFCCRSSTCCRAISSNIVSISSCFCFAFWTFSGFTRRGTPGFFGGGGAAATTTGGVKLYAGLM